MIDRVRNFTCFLRRLRHSSFVRQTTINWNSLFARSVSIYIFTYNGGGICSYDDGLRDPHDTVVQTKQLQLL